MSRSVQIPINFFKAIGEKSHHVRLYWVKWLADYVDELFRPDFIEFFQSEMKGKTLNLETIKEAYDFGMEFFKDGFVFTEEKKPKRTQKKYPENVTEVVRQVLEYLNEKANATYTSNKANTEIIVARLNEGYSISDFKIVIDNKCQQWLNTEQEKYLRPITLFQASKFENYLNEPKKTENAKPKHKSNIEKLSNASNKAKQFFT